MADLPFMKVDLHCHSQASYDCSTPLADIPPRCLEQGIRVQAITDHNEIWGAQRLQALVEERRQDGKMGQLTVIVGEEVSTSEGEIIGLFLQEKIEPGLSAEKTIARIKDQGGLVLLPHGFDPLKRMRLRPAALLRVAEAIDIVETFNARISFQRYNLAAAAWAKEHGLPMSAGTDAHTLADVGTAWVEVPARPIYGPQDLLAALREGQPPEGRWTHPVVAFGYKMWDRTRLRLWGSGA